jgi:hypothetical protein
MEIAVVSLYDDFLFFLNRLFKNSLPFKSPEYICSVATVSHVDFTIAVFLIGKSYKSKVIGYIVPRHGKFLFQSMAPFLDFRKGHRRDTGTGPSSHHFFTTSRRLILLGSAM